MFGFLISSVVLCLAVAVCAFVLWPWLQIDRRTQDADVCRDQLRSLDKDLARGTVDKAEYDAFRAEIGRRLLGSSSSQMGHVTARTGNLAIWGTLITASVLGGLVYIFLGMPDYSDAPIDARKAQASAAFSALPDQAELDANRPFGVDPTVEDGFEGLITELRSILQDRPDDLRGWALLARGESRLGNFPAAHQAQAKVIEIRGDQATAADWGLYSELLIIAAGEEFSTQSQLALQETLRRDPEAGLARFRLGQLHIRTGRPDLAFRLWARLLEEGPEQAAYIPAIRGQIDLLAASAGVPRYEQPAVRGPSVDDINAAQDMTPEDRAAMIENMVVGLADRLATEGGPAADWAQLIRAYGVLGQTDQAQAIYQEALTRFAGRPDDLRLLDAAIRAAQ